MNRSPVTSARFLNKEEEALWGELHNRILEFMRNYSGYNESSYITRVTNNWFNDHENYDGRWAIIEPHLKKGGKILDMAAGCGTFLLNGLQRGHDVWGIEPEAWKQQYFAKKIRASGYPQSYRERLVFGRGESLPFPDHYFDLVTTYQTIEHVADVRKCLEEMLRVLKPGGFLYILAPDYRSFFEPHYGIPFWPRMNKTLAAIYLKMLGRPLTALRELNWVTEKEIICMIQGLPFKGTINRTFRVQQATRTGTHPIQTIKWRIKKLGVIFREARQIDLWVTKNE